MWFDPLTEYIPEWIPVMMELAGLIIGLVLAAFPRIATILDNPKLTRPLGIFLAVIALILLFLEIGLDRQSSLDTEKRDERITSLTESLGHFQRREISDPSFQFAGCRMGKRAFELCIKNISEFPMGAQIDVHAPKKWFSIGPTTVASQKLYCVEITDTERSVEDYDLSKFAGDVPFSITFQNPFSLKVKNGPREIVRIDEVDETCSYIGNVLSVEGGIE